MGGGRGVLVPPLNAPRTSQSIALIIRPLFSTELDKDVSEQELLKMFNAFGTVTTVKIPRDATTRISLGYAYVDFLDTASGKSGWPNLMVP